MLLQRSALRAAALAVALGANAPAAPAQDVYAVRGPWLDEAARGYSLDTLRGRYTVVTMAYGACQRICSASLRAVQQIATLAQQRNIELQLLVVGLDPLEDKPADWARLHQEADWRYANLTFLTGDPAAVRRFAQRIGEKYWRYGEHTMHDFRIVLVAPDGRVARAMDRYDDDLRALLP